MRRNPLYPLMVVLLAQVAFAAPTDDETRKHVAFGASNAACGTGEPNAAIDIDRDGATTPMHFRIGVGPNGGCSGLGVTVDAQVSVQRDLLVQRDKKGEMTSRLFTVAAAGYDSSTVPFEYASNDSFKNFRGFRVETPRAMAGFGYQRGAFTGRILYNVIENRLAKGGYVAPVLVEASVELDPVELNASTDFTVRSFDAAWESDDGDVILSGSMTFGAHKLDAGAPDAIDGLARLDAPDPLYQFEVLIPF